MEESRSRCIWIWKRRKRRCWLGPGLRKGYGPRGCGVFLPGFLLSGEGGEGGQGRQAWGAPKGGSCEQNASGNGSGSGNGTEGNGSGGAGGHGGHSNGLYSNGRRRPPNPPQ